MTLVSGGRPPYHSAAPYPGLVGHGSYPRAFVSSCVPEKASLLPISCLLVVAHQNVVCDMMSPASSNDILVVYDMACVDVLTFAKICLHTACDVFMLHSTELNRWLRRLNDHMTCD